MKQIIPFHKEISFKTMIGEITSISLEHTLRLSNPETVSGEFLVSGTYKMTEASQIEEKFDYKLPVDITIDSRYDTTNSKVDIDDFYYEIINDEILKVNIDVAIDGIEEALPLEQERALTMDVEEKVILPEKDKVSLDEKVIKAHIEKPIATKIDIDRLDNEKDEEMEVMNNVMDTENKEMLTEVPKTIEPKTTKQEKIIPIKEQSSEETVGKINSIFSAFADTEETFVPYSVYIVRENDTIDSIIDRYKTTREDLSDYNNLEEVTIGTKLIIPSTIKDE